MFLGSTLRHRLEERGVRFCGTPGKFPDMPRGARTRGRCNGRANRAGRLWIATSWLKPRTKLPRYPLCEISRRASSRPARASHAAAAASAVGCVNPTRGVDCAAHDPCRHRGLIETTSGPGIAVRRAEPTPTNKDLTFDILCFSRQSCHGRGGAGVAEAISYGIQFVVRRASARTRSRCECENGRRQQPR